MTYRIELGETEKNTDIFPEQFDVYGVPVEREIEGGVVSYVSGSFLHVEDLVCAMVELATAEDVNLTVEQVRKIGGGKFWTVQLVRDYTTNGNSLRYFPVTAETLASVVHDAIVEATLQK